MNVTIDDIAEMAMEIDSQSPVEWGYLTINEKDAYRLMAMSAIDILNGVEDGADRSLVAVSTITKLLVENFVLHLRLQQYTGEDVINDRD
jgi:hypothetical protein